MKNIIVLWSAIALLACFSASAEIPVVAASDHEVLLASDDPELAQNKRLVYDFWREVFEAGHLDLAEKYLAESYIQHNPNVPTGRTGFVDFFAKFKKRTAIQDRVQMPLVSIVAENDMVVMSFVSKTADPTDASKHFTTTWFDMFRIQDGKIAEHWDPMQKR